LLPRKSGLRVLEKPLFAETEFVAFFIGQRQSGVFLGKTIPEVFDELQTFRAAKFQERCEFGVHAANVVAEGNSFNRVCWGRGEMKTGEKGGRVGGGLEAGGRRSDGRMVGGPEFGQGGRRVGVVDR
jgi:hypothetical protein